MRRPFVSPDVRLVLRRLYQRLDDSGQALIEFAFMLPVLVLLVLGVTDFALLFLRYQAITDAAREAARMAVVYDEDQPTAAQKEAEILAALKATLNRYGMSGSGAQLVTDQCGALPTAAPATIVVYECNWDGTRNDPATEAARVAIQVPNNFQFIGSFLGWATGDRVITLSTAVTMRNE